MKRNGAPCTCPACIEIVANSIEWLDRDSEWDGSFRVPAHTSAQYRRNQQPVGTPEAPIGVEVREVAEGLSKRLGIALTDVLTVIRTYARKSPPGEYADV